MTEIFVIMGKSGAGKDTLVNRLMDEFGDKFSLTKLVPYTTRKMRENEADGREYHFVSNEEMNELKEKGLVIESRSYIKGNEGEVTYATVLPKRKKGKYVTINTPEGVLKIIDGLKQNRTIKIIPIYLSIADRLLVQSVLDREHKQENPCVFEAYRRFMSDVKVDYNEKIINQIPNLITLRAENERERSQVLYKRLCRLICTNNKED